MAWCLLVNDGAVRCHQLHRCPRQVLPGLGVDDAAFQLDGLLRLGIVQAYTDQSGQYEYFYIHKWGVIKCVLFQSGNSINLMPVMWNS